MSVPSIALVPLPNFTLNAFASLIDVLRLAADESDRSRQERFKWTVLAPTLDLVRSSCGVEIMPWATLREAGRFDYVVLCGGLLRRKHDQDEAIEQFAKDAAAAGATLVGLCTGSFTLAQAGLLHGHQVSVSWLHLQEFREEFPEVEATASRLFVVDRRRVTCAGGAGAADVGAWIVTRQGGEQQARKALNIMQIDDPRSSSTPQARPPLTHKVGDPRLQRAILIMEENLGMTVSVIDMAGQIGMSRRQFERLFLAETGLSPIRYYMRLRVQYAEWMISTSARGLSEIAAICGFADAAHLSRLFKAMFGETPSERRKKLHPYAAHEQRPFRHD